MGMPGCACIPPDGDDWTVPWIRECDHHKAQREALEKAGSAGRHWHQRRHDAGCGAQEGEARLP